MRRQYFADRFRNLCLTRCRCYATFTHDLSFPSAAPSSLTRRAVTALSFWVIFRLVSKLYIRHRTPLNRPEPTRRNGLSQVARHGGFFHTTNSLSDVTAAVVEKANALNAQEIESARSSLLYIRNEKSKLDEQIESILKLMMDTGEAHPSMREKLAELEKRKA